MLHAAFQGQVEAHRAPQKIKAFYPPKTLAPAKLFSRVICGNKEKKTLSGTPSCIAAIHHVTKSCPHLSWGILAPFPFNARCKAYIHRPLLQIGIG